jgi:hypothetical protein
VAPVKAGATPRSGISECRKMDISHHLSCGANEQLTAIVP